MAAPMTRRSFLKYLFLISLSQYIRPTRLFAESSDGTILLRPPGSLTEEDLAITCIRCGICQKSCPSQCLKPAPIQAGLSIWKTPIIIPRKAGCIRCLTCSKVCPSGAILTPPMEEIKMGTAVIHRERCLVWTHQKECLVCKEYCPVAAIRTDARYRPIVERTKCVGCGLCEQNCPVLEKRAAIEVFPQGEKRHFLPEKTYRSI